MVETDETEEKWVPIKTSPVLYGIAILCFIIFIADVFSDLDFGIISVLMICYDIVFVFLLLYRKTGGGHWDPDLDMSEYTTVMVNEIFEDAYED